MKRCFLVALVLLSVSLYPPETTAEMDPRVRTVLFMSGFGTVGGALLGMASKAFNNSDSFGRAVTKGASLGLYAGILFSSYIVITHHLRSGRMSDEEGLYPHEAASIYEEGSGGDYPYDDGRLRYKEPSSFQQASYGMEKPVRFLPLFYFNILKFQF
ncbi:MAG: hypothetical protein OXB84_08060 [Halobacteriovoraceae bacterium]|nr:hypothetical protein [Halobacteriovoraceae bacterium]